MLKAGKVKSFFSFRPGHCFLHSWSFREIWLPDRKIPFRKLRKIAGISENERETLQKLFIQTQEVEEAAGEEKAIALDIETIKGEIGGLQKAIADEETAYAKKEKA